MTMDTDLLLDRIRLKRQLTNWRGLAIIFLAALVIAIAGGKDLLGGRTPQKDTIARIAITGIIEDDQERMERIEEIANNDHIKAVILYVNSPGGTVVGGESLYYGIKKIAAKKPVAVVMGDLATSAGYLVSIAGNQLFARNGTLTGSIGVLLQSAEITELAQKVGVTMDVIKSAPLKGSPSPFEKMSPEARASMQSLIDSFYGIFVDMVAAERKLPRDEVLRLADGRVYTGTQAIGYKLIDAIGGEDEALAWLQNKRNIAPDLKVKEVALEPKPGKIEELFQDFGGKIGFGPVERISLQGLVSIW